MKTQTHKHKQTSFNQKDRNKPHRATMHPDFVTVQTKYQAEHGTWYMEEQIIKCASQKCTNAFCMAIDMTMAEKCHLLRLRRYGHLE